MLITREVLIWWAAYIVVTAAVAWLAGLWGPHKKMKPGIMASLTEFFWQFGCGIAFWAVFVRVWWR